MSSPESNYPAKEITIAVAGDEGSFSHEAGVKYAGDEGIKQPQFRFAIDMEGVFTFLDAGKATFGVLPIHNSITGLVIHTIQAMGRHNFELVCHMPVLINQCLLAFPGVQQAEITRITSHPQALEQCAGFIVEHYPGAEVMKYRDTALAARDLRDGKLDHRTAVIASATAAKIYELQILKENIQDEHPNITTFIVVAPPGRGLP